MNVKEFVKAYAAIAPTEEEILNSIQTTESITAEDIEEIISQYRIKYTPSGNLNILNSLVEDTNIDELIIGRFYFYDEIDDENDSYVFFADYDDSLKVGCCKSNGSVIAVDIDTEELEFKVSQNFECYLDLLALYNESFINSKLRKKQILDNFDTINQEDNKEFISLIVSHILENSES